MTTKKYYKAVYLKPNYDSPEIVDICDGHMHRTTEGAFKCARKKNENMIREVEREVEEIRE